MAINEKSAGVIAVTDTAGKDPGAAAGQSPLYLKHFDRQVNEISWFWPRFGGAPDFTGKRVLDVGCGLGALCIDLAKRGAGEIVGVEIDERFVEFARADLAIRFPKHADTITYHCADLCELDTPKFDYIVTKDVFEHVFELDRLMETMVDKLAEGGRMYIGFGPMWYSPFGDHKLSRALSPGNKFAIPWGHLLVSEERLMKAVNDRGRDIPSIEEYGISKRDFSDYERVLKSTGLTVEYYRTNVTHNPLGRLASAASHIPLLRRYLTSTIYCVLHKPAA